MSQAFQHIDFRHGDPKFISIVGPMFASKSLRLYEYADRMKRAGLMMQAFKPERDSSTTNIVSRFRNEQIEAISLKCISDIFDHISPGQRKGIIIDEAHFFTGESQPTKLSTLALTLSALHASGNFIVMAGLDRSASGKAYLNIAEAVMVSEIREHYAAQCEAGDTSDCHRAAFLTKRIGHDSRTELLPGRSSDLYKPCCPKHACNDWLNDGLTELNRSAWHIH
jgi:thymidine kinase